MIEQHLSNTNESATVLILQKENETKYGPNDPKAGVNVHGPSRVEDTTAHRQGDPYEGYAHSAATRPIGISQKQQKYRTHVEGGGRGLRNIRRARAEMATVLPLAAASASASTSAAPRTCISGGLVPAPFLGARVRLRIHSPPRGVACALRRRPSKYKVTSLAPSRRCCLISSSHIPAVLSWLVLLGSV